MNEKRDINYGSRFLRNNKNSKNSERGRITISKYLIRFNKKWKIKSKHFQN